MSKKPKVYIVTGVVLNGNRRDCSGDVFDLDGVEFPEQAEVYLQNRTVPQNFLGVADLTRKGDKIVAEVRLIAEKFPPALLKAAYPSVSGKITKRDGDGRVTGCKVEYISIDFTGNSDTSIKPLKIKKKRKAKK